MRRQICLALLAASCAEPSDLTVQPTLQDASAPADATALDAGTPPMMIDSGPVADAGFAPDSALTDALPIDAGQSPTQDLDGDGLSDALEDTLGTSRLDPDTDRDGIPDGWEHAQTNGCELVDGGCDPLHRDILVEVDYQLYVDDDGQQHSARLSDAVVEALVAFFARQSIANPDGSSGIRLHVLFDDAHTLGADHLCYYDSGVHGDQSTSDFPRETFHKATLCIGGARGNSPLGGPALKIRSREIDDNPSNDMTERAQFTWYRLFIHELGHSLGLLHGGRQNTNRKANYPSVMNYRYDEKVLPAASRTLADNDIDFSSGAFAAFPLDTCALDEKGSFPGLTASQVAFMTVGNSGYTVVDGPDGPWVDWDGDGVFSDVPVAAQISDTELTNCGRLFPPALLRDYDDRVIIARCMASAVRGNPNPKPDNCPG